MSTRADSTLLPRVLRAATRLALKPILGARTPVAIQRQCLALIARGLPPPRGTRHSAIDMNGVAAERVEHGTAGNSLRNTILYLHGGGYCVGSPLSHRALTGQLALKTGVPVHVPDYRLAPEHPHPAALDDALATYQWLLENGYRGEQISIAGDSAGGGLALCTALALRDSGLPLPSSLILLSPWTDLEMGGDSMTTRAARDPMLSRNTLRRWGNAYLGAIPAQHPLCSPLNADLKGLPPMLIQVGSEEVLFSDSERLYQSAVAAGIPSTLREYEGLWHDFQLQAGLLRGAADAVAEIAEFVASRW